MRHAGFLSTETTCSLFPPRFFFSLKRCSPLRVIVWKWRKSAPIIDNRHSRRGACIRRAPLATVVECSEQELSDRNAIVGFACFVDIEINSFHAFSPRRKNRAFSLLPPRTVANLWSPPPSSQKKQRSIGKSFRVTLDLSNSRNPSRRYEIAIVQVASSDRNDQTARNSNRIWFASLDLLRRTSFDSLKFPRSCPANSRRLWRCTNEHTVKPKIEPTLRPRGVN